MLDALARRSPLWNALFEMMVVRGVKDYLLAAVTARGDAGRAFRRQRSVIGSGRFATAAWVRDDLDRSSSWIAAGLTDSLMHPLIHDWNRRVRADTAPGDAGR